MPNSSLVAPLTAILMSALTVSCGGVRTKQMLPASVSSVATHHAHSIRVGSITGNKKQVFGGPSQINAEEFRAVLVETFVRSRLFSSVEESAADLEISAKVLAQGQVSKGLTAEQALVVEYRLVELRTGKEIWKQPINSRQVATVGDALAGAARTRMAQEGCVRKNLEQLIEGLSRLKIE